MVAYIIPIKAPAGPLILYLLPPNKETINPPMIAVKIPMIGIAPEAIANAIDSGIATIATVSPDSKSFFKK